MQSGEMRPVRPCSVPVKVPWLLSNPLPPLEAGFGRCAPSATSSGQTDASTSETSEDDDDGLSSRLADRPQSSENGTGMTDDECYDDEHHVSEPDA